MGKWDIFSYVMYLYNHPKPQDHMQGLVLCKVDLLLYKLNPAVLVLAMHNIDVIFLHIAIDTLALSYPEGCNRLVAILSGHGNSSTLQLHDGESISADDVISKFKAGDVANPTLGRIVKVFFFNACHGDREESGYATRSTTNAKAPVTNNCIHICDANVLVAYSCMCYHCAFEDRKGGGIWTKCLLEELENPEEDS